MKSKKSFVLVALTLAMLLLSTPTLGLNKLRVLLYRGPGFEGDWTPSCEYGTYDSGLGKCVYTPDNFSCQYGDFDEEIGKCKFKRYQRGVMTTWVNSKRICESLGGHLVTIMSPDENSAVTSFGEQLWMGLNDIAQEGHWVWVTGEPVPYTDWASGEPRSSEHDCARLYHGDWYSFRCNYLGDRCDTMCEWDWEFGAVGLCPEGYTYEEERDYGYCYGSRVPQCPEAYVYNSGMGKCLGDPK